MINLKAMPISSRLFFYSIGLICLTYGIFEYFFIPYSTLAADEFVFARHIYDYTAHIPYLHFPPYKSTVGHYLLAIPLFISHDILNAIYYIKDELAVINILLLALTCYWLARIYARRAIVLSILAIIANHFFLIYSTELRVDMLTTWACLLSVIAILEHRPRLAGFLLSVAFLISQKAIWYFLAMNFSLSICFLAFNQPIYRLRTLIIFNQYVLIPIIAYLVFWSCIAGPRIVLTNFFYDAYVQIGINLYAIIYSLCWRTVLEHGPCLFFFWPLAACYLFLPTKKPETQQRRVFIAIYSSSALLLFICYKQAFPYNFVFAVPAFLLLFTEFFTCLYKTDYTLPNITHSKAIFTALMLIYIAAFSLLILILRLSAINYLALLVPSALMVYFYYPHLIKNRAITITALFTVIAIIIPAQQTITASTILRGHYQQTNLRLSAELLREGGSYLGGVPFIYNLEQPIAGMKNLIAPQISYLNKPISELKPLLLSSLFLAVTTPEQVLIEFSKQPVKLIINDYRIQNLPTNILKYIENNYAHYYGSIYLYAPKVAAGMQTVNVKFAANYRIDGAPHAFINMDGVILQTGYIIKLTAGKHISSSQTPYRLTLLPQKSASALDPAYKEDHSTLMIKQLVV